MTEGQGQRSRSNLPKIGKNTKQLDAISPTDFIFDIKVQPNKAHSVTQVLMTLTKGQGQRSRSNFPKIGKKSNNWPYLGQLIVRISRAY